MKAKKTIKQMVKEILFDATYGQRSSDNYAKGMEIIDSLQYLYYREYFDKIYAVWVNGERSSRRILSEIRSNLKMRGLYNDRARRIAESLDTFLYA